MATTATKRQKTDAKQTSTNSTSEPQPYLCLSELQKITIGEFSNCPSVCNQKLLEQTFERQLPNSFVRTYIINQRVCPTAGILLCVVNRKTAVVEFSRVFQSVAIIHSFTSTSKTLVNRSQPFGDHSVSSVPSSLLYGGTRFSVKKRCPLQDRMMFNTSFDCGLDYSKGVCRYVMCVCMSDFCFLFVFLGILKQKATLPLQ